MTLPEARRSARLLGISWAVSWAGIPVAAAFGSVIVFELTGNRALTGLPYFLIYVGSLLASYPAGHYMDRLGRKPVLIAGHLVAALGYLIGTVAIIAGNLWLFLGANLIAAMGGASTFMTRLAAADLYPARERARGLGRLVFYLVFGAAASVPLIQLAQRFEGVFGSSYLVLAWALIPILSIAAALIVWRVQPDTKVTAARIEALEPVPAGGATAADGPVRWRVLLPAGITLLFAQATMASMMSVSGAALADDGHGPDFIILTLTLHVIGMFGFSPLVGIIGDRWGRRSLLLVSAVYLLIATAVTQLIAVGAAFTVALVAIGIGWSFAFIGSTTIIADTVPIARRGRITGTLDFATAIVGAAASLGAGWALEEGGIRDVAGLGLFLAFGVLVAAFAAPSLRAKPAPTSTGKKLPE